MLFLSKFQSTEFSVIERAKLYALGLSSWLWMSHFAHLGLGWKMHWGKTKISNLRKTFGIRYLFYPPGCSVTQCHEVVRHRHRSLPVWVWNPVLALTNHMILAISFVFLIRINICLISQSCIFTKWQKKTMSKHYWECEKALMEIDIKTSGRKRCLVVCRRIKGWGLTGDDRVGTFVFKVWGVFSMWIQVLAVWTSWHWSAKETWHSPCAVFYLVSHEIS